MKFVIGLGILVAALCTPLLIQWKREQTKERQRVSRILWVMDDLNRRRAGHEGYHALIRIEATFQDHGLPRDGIGALLHRMEDRGLIATRIRGKAEYGLRQEGVNLLESVRNHPQERTWLPEAP